MLRAADNIAFRMLVTATPSHCGVNASTAHQVADMQGGGGSKIVAALQQRDQPQLLKLGVPEQLRWRFTSSVPAAAVGVEPGRLLLCTSGG